MTNILQDVRFALRRLWTDRSFSVAAIAALVLGIGANSAVFTIVNGVLLRSLPFDEPDRIVRIDTRDAQGRERGTSLEDFYDWQRASHAFSGLALAYSTGSMFLSADSDPAERYNGAYLSANGFAIIGVSPTIGRGFTAEDDRPGASQVVLLSHRIWQSRYGGDPSIVGRAVAINTSPATVIGVMPEGVGFPFDGDVWLPLSQIPQSLSRTRNTRDFLAYGRLADGVPLARARSELSAISKHLAGAYPDTNKGVTAVVRAYREGLVPADWRLLLWSLMGAVGFVLLIACANVANLLLARAAARAREIAVRASIGATRWQIVRQLLVESVIIAFISGVIGLALARFGVQWFDAEMQQLGRPYWITFEMDASVFGFFAAVCFSTALVFGLAPALYLSKTAAYDVLKDGGRSVSAGVRSRTWSAGIVVAQLALTVVLLAGGGFMVRSFLSLYRADIGFDTSRLLTMSLSFPARKYADFGDRIAFLHRLDERLNAIGAIEGASSMSYLPDGKPAGDRRSTSPNPPL